MTKLARWGLPTLMSANQFDSVFRQMDDIFNALSSHPFERTTTPYDVLEIKDSAGNITALKVEIPAIKSKKEDIDISVDTDNASLNITIGKVENDNTSYVYHSIGTGKRSFTFMLGDTVDISNISSKLEDGLLTVYIPKLPEVEKTDAIRKIAVD